MSRAKVSLVEVIFEIVKQGGAAAIYFGAHVTTVVKASFIPESPDVLICETINGDPITIETASIIAVREQTPIDDV